MAIGTWRRFVILPTHKYPGQHLLTLATTEEIYAQIKDKVPTWIKANDAEAIIEQTLQQLRGVCIYDNLRHDWPLIQIKEADALIICRVANGEGTLTHIPEAIAKIGRNLRQR